MNAIQETLSADNMGAAADIQPRDISKRDRLIVVLLTVISGILLFRPMIAYFNVWRGDQYAHTGQIQEAARAYRKALLLDPNNAPAHDGLGNAYESLNQFNKAIAEYEKAVKAAPQLAYYHYILGISRLRLKNYGGALGHLRKAVRLDPTDFNHHRALASAYQGLGQKKKALEVLGEIERRFKIGNIRARRPELRGAIK
ncbi:MAG: tetratricopeptide repeat protein [Actinomycetota bacterium]|nr:tetratricopeptide repeat protein [Actinomycetota bacterium]